MPALYIDGQEGTTGLKIRERINGRTDIDLMVIDQDKRKDNAERKKLLNAADIVILCLPDIASREAVSLVENPKVRIIDASTAFRTDPSWAYGLPELSAGHLERIAKSPRVCVPGCHATGFIVSVYPLIQAGIITPDYPFICTSITGYSGGGKKLIAKYESSPVNLLTRPYALKLAHKHIPEMQKIPGLTHPPLFTPILGHFYNGMIVTVPLHTRLFKKNSDEKAVHECFSSYYKGRRFIKVMPLNDETSLDEGAMSAVECNGTNRLELFVYGHKDQVLVIARFDNLGKGASMAAVQNMNIMLGLDEATGLAG